MKTFNLSSLFSKLAGLAIALSIAGVLVYRGNTFTDPTGPGLIVPLMCVMSALFLVVTVATMTLRSDAGSELETAI